MSFVVDTAIVSARPAGAPPRAAILADAPAAAPPPPTSLESCNAALVEGAAPVASLSATHLWPPNHALADVGMTVDATAECRGLVDVVVEVFADEPASAPTGDGTTVPDALFVGSDLYLRSERMGTADGRVYLLLARASTTGATGVSCRTVVVPHSGSPASLAAVTAQANAARATCAATHHAPPSFHLHAHAPVVRPNRAPAVSAGADQAIDAGGVATLGGTVTDDGLPAGSLAVSWSTVSGPAQAVFASPASPETTASFGPAGVYVLRLSADDGELQGTDELTVTVASANDPPVVAAGDDQTLVLPANVATLAGTVTDDGHPGPTPAVSWSVVEAPAGGTVSFSSPATASTLATFLGAGAYLLRLTADDGQLSASDDVGVVVLEETPPVLNVADATVVEGDEGRGGGQVVATLSKTWPRPVTVDFMTTDGTATAQCDYNLRFGTVTFAPGQTEASILVPVTGELKPEADETVVVHLGNASEASLPDDQATITIVDDDVANRPPALAGPRAPADGADGLAAPVALTWSATDPDAGDTVLHDVFLGTAASIDGQSWWRTCPPAPGPAAAAASAFDDASDALLVVEETGGATGSTLWTLADASGAGGPAAWSSRVTTGLPALRSARAVFVPGSGALALVGACDACPGLQAWVLDDAAGVGSVWRGPLAPATAPPGRDGFAVAGSPDGVRIFVFGGRDAAGARGDAWVLSDVDGLAPAWQAIPAAAAPPGRDGAAMVVAGNPERLIVFGGRTDDGTVSAESWILDDPAGASPGWRVAGGAAPPARFRHAAAYDAGTDRVIVFGGTTAGVSANTNFVFGDAWILDGESWQRIAGASTAPSGRFDAAVAFSPSANRLIVAAGRNNKLAQDPSDLWILDDAMGRLPAVALAQASPLHLAALPDPGDTYLWRVVSRDSHGAWRGSPVWRFTGNRRPHVDSGADRVVGLPPGTATLAAIADDDGLPSGSQLSLRWRLVSGPGPVSIAGEATAAPVVSFGAEGIYVLAVTASDGALAGADEVTVTVEPSNAAPLVSAGVDRTGVAPNATIALDGSATDDGLPSNGTLGTTWSQVAGPAAVAFANPAHPGTAVTFGPAGVYVLRLTASDGAETRADDVTIGVSPPNAAPMVSAGPDLAVTLPALSVTLAGTVVDDGLPSGQLSHSWAVLSGPAPVTFSAPLSAVTTASFTQVGAYRLRLSVSDGALSADDEARVVVGSPDILPDLQVDTVDATSLAVDPRTLAMAGTVAAEVVNAGPGSAVAAFAVTFFEDRDGNGAYDPAVDATLATATAGPLGPGERQSVVAAAAGTAAFAGNLVHALVDSGRIVAETDEGNNTASSAPACAGAAPVRAASPALEWSWTGSATLPLSNKAWGTPLVIDLDLDGRPEILFHSNKSNGIFDYAFEGSLRAVDGVTHAERFTTSGADRWLSSMVQLAAGNIDADPYPEILAGAQGGSNLLAFEHDGTLKWRSAPLEIMQWGATVLADLDGDGAPEIVFGRQVLNADGTLRWSGTGARGNNGGDRGGNSIVVDLDLDGRPEVVAGNTAYRGSGPQQGQILWQTASAPGGPVRDGYTAAANLDADPNPEIVLVASGVVWMLEHDGAVKWGPVPIPNGATWGGTPAIGNVDDDPALEIVVGGRERLVAFDAGGTVAWTAPSVNSTNSGSAALFDFDGDGAAEVVFQDERSLRIFNRGQRVFEVPTWGVGGLGVVVADADGDGDAEIVYTENGVFTVVPDAPALRVYGDAADTWLRSRPIWNQFDYHVSNVEDGGTIPAVESRTLAYSRQNLLARVGNGGVAPGCAYAKPDLTASYLRVAGDATATQLTVRIGNGGAAPAGRHVPVSFYDGDPRAGGSHLASVSTDAPMAPGAFEDVAIALPSSVRTRQSLWIAVDDFGSGRGMTTESDEDNNWYDAGRALLGGASLPDLAVTTVDVAAVATDADTLAMTGEARVVVRNQGIADAAGTFAVTLFDDTDADGVFDPQVDATLGAQSRSGLGAGASAEIAVPVSGTARFAGSRVHAMADSGAAIAEADETNNVGTSSACRVPPPAGPFETVIERRWISSASALTSTNVTATPVVADLDGDRIADVVFVTFAGGAVAGAGRLRAVSGRDGHELFTVTDPAHALSGWGNLAVADIDGDGRPEIVAVHELTRLIAFEHDGTFKWLSPPLQGIEWGAPSIADLDADGVPEIVLGRQALRADGSIRWTAAGSNRGGNGGGTFATVADLDLDGLPEVLVGDAAYSGSGLLRWNSPLPDGHTAVGNFDDDPYPEIVLVSANQVWLLEHDGTRRWGPLPLAGNGLAGAPVIADVDGDGRPEIGVGMQGTYNVVETAGQLRWSVATNQAASPWNIGLVASAFDFDGDGAAELVLSDETGVKVLRGSNGSLLASHPVPSCLIGRGYPVVADADGDGNAEIVTIANRTCSPSAAVGIAVIGEAGDRWANARPVWNQYDYTVTNVADSLAVPARAAPSWASANTFRANSTGAGSPFRAPDLTASHVRRAEDGGDLLFTVRVGNAGDEAAGPGVQVSAYNGNPQAGFPFVSSAATTQRLAPGAFEDVIIRLSSTLAAEDALHFGVDRGQGAGVVAECDEHNLVATGFFLNRKPVASAGTDASLIQPQEIATLSGSGSDDGLPFGSTLSFRWDYLSGPTEAPPDIADPTVLTTTVRLLVPGLYLFRLTASDSLRSYQDVVAITLYPANQRPVVSAGPDRVLDHPALSTTLVGSVADDGLPAGATVSQQWSVVGTPPGSVAFGTPAASATSVQFGATGTYVLRLTATDGALSAFDDAVVIVDPANTRPVVSAGPDRVIAGRTTTLAGSVSDDGLPRGGQSTATWSLVEGAGTASWSDVHSPQGAVQFSADGLYLLRLTATDGSLFAYDDVVVRVNPVNARPVVDAGPDLALTADRTTLAATVVDDGLPVGAAVTAAWSVASGPGHVTFSAPAAPGTEAVFSADGTYVLRLTASDTALQSYDELTVTVAAGNHAPWVSAGADVLLPAGVFTASVAGQIEDDGVPGGAPAATWSQVSGPGNAVFATPQALASAVSLDAPGVYVLRLTGWDGELAAQDDVQIVAPAQTPTGDPPTATLSTPAAMTPVTAPLEVTGAVGSASLLGWALEYRRRSADGWTRFAGGTSAGAVAGTLDPTMFLNGLYEVRLRATDRAGRSATSVVDVVVRGNAKVGAFSVSFVDLEVPVAGLPIRMTRTYDSRDKGRGDYGFGWRMDVSTVRVEETGIAGLGWIGTRSAGNFPAYCLQTARPRLVTLTMPDGKVLEFEPAITPQCQPFTPIENATVGFRARPGTLGVLEPVGGAAVHVVGGWPAPLQSASLELYGAHDFQIYDPGAYRYTSPDGRVFVVDQVSGLRSMSDRSGNTVTVSANGITHSSGKGISFIRDAAGRIATVADPAGHSTLYTYDAAGDLASVTDRAGHTTRFAYHGRFAHHLERISDPLGRQPIRNEYYDDGRIKSHTDAFGKTIHYSHDVAARQEVVVDRNGKQRVLDFDARGNVVREVDAAGKAVVRTFDTRDNRLTETVPHAPGDPAPAKTTYTYDAADNVTSTTDPGGHRTEYTYNARQQVVTTKDARGKVSENTYDPVTGNLLTSRDAAGNVTTFTYDAQGNVKTQVAVVDGVAVTTQYDYDAHGNLVKEKDALGHETTFTYDANGNRLTQTTTRGLFSCGPAGCAQTSVQTLTTTYTYDAAGRLTRTEAPDGGVTRTVYDELGRQKETFDALDRRTGYTYDEMGRLTRTDFADQSYEASTYDNEGRRLTSRDRDGNVTTYGYDDVGRLIRTTFADGTYTESTYDAAGRLVASRDARGKTTSYGYDGAGRRTLVRDPLGNETIFAYDANGNQASVRDARLFTTTFEYDDLNRRVRTVFPDTTFTRTSYDVLGRRRSETDQAGRVTSFDYDAVGRLTKVTDAAGKETRYSYDQLGNRIAQRDALGHVTAFEYDKAGRETARILPDGSRESRTYDVAGNVERRTDFLGRETSYTYDALGRLLTRVYPDPAANVSFTYTPGGRRLTATDARGTTTYAFDTRQRLASLTYPDGRKLEYGYDGNGARTSLTARIGALALSSGFTYDDAGRLDIVTDPAGRAYDHGYDANGNRASLGQPNGTITAYTYDSLNRLTNLSTTRPASGTTIQGYGFTLGPSGNRTAINEADGSVRTYTYDSLYRLTGERITVLGALQYEKVFTYDDVGNRQTQATTGSGAPGTPLAPGSVGYSYDTRDRLLTETLGAAPPTAYTYDDNGNLLTNSAEATYTWDFENRLVRVAKTDGTVVEHTYDVDGVRVSTRVTPAGGPAAVTNFLVDPSGSLSHVVAETNGAGTLQAYYVRGDDLVAVMRPLVPGPVAPADWQTRYVHADGIGSIRRLTDEAGLITDGYTYTAFGELIAHTGTDAQPYAFAGEPYDPNSGFQYHRARWMSPRVGTFLGMDPWRGVHSVPASLHRYQYAYANPTNRTDPTGLIAWWVVARFVGREVHSVIGFDFETRRPGAFTNYFSVSTVLGINRNTCWPSAAFCDRQPDLADGLGVPDPEVYEIKAEGGFGEGYSVGLADMLYYLTVLNANDPQGRMWRPGSTFIPRPVFYVPSWGGWLIFPKPARQGVILYEAKNLPATISTLVTVGVLMASSRQGVAVGQAIGFRLAFGGPFL